MRLEEKLTVLRKKKGLTQADLAEAVCVSRQAVSKWETGRALPSAENLMFLSELFGVSVDYLLHDGMEEPEPNPAVEEPGPEPPAKEAAVPEKEGGEERGPSGNGKKNDAGRKYIAAFLLLAALLIGVFIGMFVKKYSDEHISIENIVGEEVDHAPDGEFYVGW